MNFSQILLAFLKSHGEASFPGFGTFYLKNTKAALDAQGKNILPPAAEAAFKTETGGNAQAFSKYLAQERNINSIDADLEIKKQVNYWNATLYKEKQVVAEPLGTFFLEESKILFVGNKIDHLSPDFYGLEQINIAELKNSTRRSGKSYRFGRLWFWLIPVLLIIGAISYLGLMQPELIVGKKSFPMKEPVTKVAPVLIDSLKQDSLKTIQIAQDSLIEDSLQKATVPLKTSPRKWSSKNYSKNKWKKQKKRQNR